jgi:hypothetical protein
VTLKAASGGVNTIARGLMSLTLRAVTAVE